MGPLGWLVVGPLMLCWYMLLFELLLVWWMLKLTGQGVALLGGGIAALWAAARRRTA